MFIRPVTPADLKACAEVQIHSEKRGASMRRERIEKTLKNFRRRLEDETFAFLVAEQSGCIIGYIVFQYEEWNSSVYIEGIFVHQDSQHHGVGSALLAAADRHAQNRHARAIFLDTRKESNSALQFYKKNGFAVAGSIRGFYNEFHGDALVLSRAVKKKHTSNPV